MAATQARLSLLSSLREWRLVCLAPSGAVCLVLTDRERLLHVSTWMDGLTAYHGSRTGVGILFKPWRWWFRRGRELDA